MLSLLHNTLKRSNTAISCHWTTHPSPPTSSFKLPIIHFSSLHQSWYDKYTELSTLPLKTQAIKETTKLDRILATTPTQDSILLFEKDINPSLKEWIYNQRKRYKNNKIATDLIQDQIELLNNMGFIWDVNEFIWNVRFTELKLFTLQFGHSIIPRHYTPFPKLCSWVYNIRACKLNQTRKVPYENKGYLSTQEIAEFDKLNFIWSVEEAKWLEKYNELKEFVRVNGHTRVTSRMDRSLARWVRTQRVRCKNEERRVLLDDIGFIWGFGGVDRYRRVAD